MVSSELLRLGTLGSFAHSHAPYVEGGPAFVSGDEVMKSVPRSRNESSRV